MTDRDRETLRALYRVMRRAVMARARGRGDGEEAAARLTAKWESMSALEHQEMAQAWARHWSPSLHRPTLERAASTGAPPSSLPDPCEAETGEGWFPLVLRANVTASGNPDALGDALAEAKRRARRNTHCWQEGVSKKEMAMEIATHEGLSPADAAAAISDVPDGFVKGGGAPGGA